MNVKFSTKFIAASAAAVMALSLAGCSGGSMDDSSSSSAKASGDTITIGTVTTNSGTAAAYGEAEVKGFELAVSEINAKGGINGKKVKLESMDDKGDATERPTPTTSLLATTTCSPWPVRPSPPPPQPWLRWPTSPSWSPSPRPPPPIPSKPATTCSAPASRTPTRVRSPPASRPRT